MQTPHLVSRPTALLLLVSVVLLLLVPTAAGQAIDPEGRRILDVRIRGLVDAPEQLIRNTIRVEPGTAYDTDTVNGDLRRLTRLGRFSLVDAVVEPTDDGLILTYEVVEEPLIADIRIEGNKTLSDLELLDRIVLRPGDPADTFLIERATRQLREAYQEEGFFVVSIEADAERLADTRELVFRVREGPRVRVRKIQFEGNERFPDRQLREEVRQPTHFPILKDGHLNREILEQDQARLRDFLRNRGHLDGDAGFDIQMSPDQREAIVTFVVFEGPRYTVTGVESASADGEPLALPAAQLLLASTLKPGSVYSTRERDRSVEAIRDLYGKLGYLDTRVRIEPRFAADAPEVRLDITVDEGRAYTVGNVTVRGNNLTQTKVILRELRGLEPGRRFDRTARDRSVRRLNESPLFRDATITALGGPDDEVRDVLVEVTERNTGSVTFGANVSSDLGLGGAIDITQRNFDITDFPTSVADLVSGKAFRGAGRTFDLTLSPGARNSTYSVNWRDPYFLDSDFSFGGGLFYTTRERADFDEDRAGGTLALGRRFGDIWSASLRGRYNRVDIDDIESDASVDVFDVEGANDLTSLGFSVVRTTADSLFFPSRGSRLTAGVDRVGALGGDFDFTRLNTSFTKFWTVDEDFLNRKTIVSFRASVGYIVEENEAPVFERFYAGGRSFRGFDFRGIGPRGIRNDTGELGDESVGGSFSVLTTLQYEFPLIDEFLRGVIFTDQGTIDGETDLSDWRITVGAGIRMQVPFLSQAPFAVDFAIPIEEEDTDETEVISFTLDVPFR